MKSSTNAKVKAENRNLLQMTLTAIKDEFIWDNHRLLYAKLFILFKMFIYLVYFIRLGALFIYTLSIFQHDYNLHNMSSASSMNSLTVATAAIFGSLGLLWLYKKLRSQQRRTGLKDKVVLITGASSGVGEGETLLNSND